MDIKAKIEVSFKIEDIEKALKERGIVVNQSNMRKFIKMIQNASFSISENLYDEAPKDKKILLMYGFKFEK